MSCISTRRQFLASALAGAIALPTLRPSAPAMRVGVLAPPATRRSNIVQHALDGLALGASEASHTAALFGTRMDFVQGGWADGQPVRAAARRLLDDGVQALCIALPAADAQGVHALAGDSQRLCIDLLAPAPEHGGSVRGWSAYVTASATAHAETVLRALAGELRAVWNSGSRGILPASQRADAGARQLAASFSWGSPLADLPTVHESGSPRGLAVIVLAAESAIAAAELLSWLDSAGATPTVVDLFGATSTLARHHLPEHLVRAGSWRPDLTRYGAAQLNDRFRARYGHLATMDSPAWNGWFAAKALVESMLRAHTGAARDIRDELFALRFDGHKGTPLFFDDVGQLVQPLYLTDGIGAGAT